MEMATRTGRHCGLIASGDRCGHTRVLAPFIAVKFELEYGLWRRCTDMKETRLDVFVIHTVHASSKTHVRVTVDTKTTLAFAAVVIHAIALWNWAAGGCDTEIFMALPRT